MTEQLLYVTKQIRDHIEIVEGPFPESKARWHADQLVGKWAGAIIGLCTAKEDHGDSPTIPIYAMREPKP